MRKLLFMVRELWGSRRSLWLPGLALVISILCLGLLEAFQFQIEQKLKREGRQSLGADMQVRARVPLPDAAVERIRQLMPEGSGFYRAVEVNTMLLNPKTGEARLVDLTGVEGDFPLYGVLEINKPSETFSTAQGLILSRDVAQVFSLEEGDQVSVGGFNTIIFAIADRVEVGPSRFVTFAPSVWTSLSFLETQTNLMERSVRIDYEYYFEAAVDDSALQTLQTQVRDLIDDPRFRVSIYSESERGFQRIYDQVTLYANLVSVAALMIASFALLGTFQTWFYQRRYLIAILRASGASRRDIIQLLMGVLLLFCGLCSFVGLGLGAAVFEFSKPAVARFIDLGNESFWSLSVIVTTTVVGIVTPLLLGWVAVLGALSFKPLLLLRDQKKMVIERRWILTWGAGGFLYFMALFAYLVRDLERALWVGAALLIALVIGVGLQQFCLLQLSRLPLKSLVLRYSLRSMMREKWGALLSATIFFMIALLLSSVMVIQSGLLDEISVSDEVRASEFFIFDVGEEDQPRLTQFLERYPGAEATWASQVRVRWLTANGRNVFETGEGEDRAPFTAEIAVGEASANELADQIVAGEFWTADYSEGLPEVSVTRDFARRHGLEIGDRLGFELFGIPFEAKLTSLRLVRWTSFQPGYRILIQRGYFDGLSRDFVAALQFPASLDRVQFRRDFAKEFPSVSSVNLASLKQELSRVTRELGFVLLGILGLLLLVGLSLVAALVREKAESRKYELALMKVVGARGSQVRALLLSEFVLLSVPPLLSGGVMGWAIAHAVMHYFFAFEVWIFPIQWLALLVGIFLAIQLVAAALSRELVRTKPKVLIAQ
jgi:putative ABC transport system permease protein